MKQVTSSVVTDQNLQISKGVISMPDKNPKNKNKLKERAEEKHEVEQEWKHESPAEKKETHDKENAENKPELDEA